MSRGLETDSSRRIAAKLAERLETDKVEVLDESCQHAGHAHAEAEGSHMWVRITSDQLGGSSRVKAHQAVYAALKDELDAGLHALRIEVVKR